MSEARHEAHDAKKKAENASTAPAKRWYDANCHCRAVQLRMKLPPLYPDAAVDPESVKTSQSTSGSSDATKDAEAAASGHGVTHCNCSICTKNGFLSVYPDKETELEFVKGYETLGRYQFASKIATHRFCPSCGSSVMVEIVMGGQEKVAVNARMIKGINPDKLNLVFFDGWKILGHPYDE